MTSKQIAWAAVAAAVLLAVAPPIGHAPSAPTSPEYTPPPADQALVAPLGQVLAGHPQQAASLASFYAAAADVLEADSARPRPAIHTTIIFREWLELATAMRFGKDPTWTPVQGLAASVHGSQGILAHGVGLQAAKLDYPKAIRVLRALAWQCRKGGA